MKRSHARLSSDSKFFFGCVVVMVSLLGSGATNADSKDDLASRKNDWDSVKRRMSETSAKVNSYLERSRSAREMDKEKLDALITQICKLDIARDGDRGDKLAEEIRNDLQKKVIAAYEILDAEATGLENNDVEPVLADAKRVYDDTKGLTSYPEIQSDASALLQEMSDEIGKFTDRTYQRLSDDYKALDNLKRGEMYGANNPKTRAAMEYGKERHIYNQKMCHASEIVLDSGGRPDCVSFQKDSCIVWEFKPDTWDEDDAEDEAREYLEGVQMYFMNQPIAIENCKKDSNGLPLFEARGVTYPACRP